MRLNATPPPPPPLARASRGYARNVFLVLEKYMSISSGQTKLSVRTAVRKAEVNCFCTFHLRLQSPLTPEPNIPLGHAHL